MYQEASRILQAVYQKSGTAKTLCLTSKWKNKKQMYALVYETLKYSDVIDKILEKTKVVAEEKRLKNDKNLARVMVYDFLFGKVTEATQKGTKSPLARHRNALKAELARMKIKAGVTRNEDLLSEAVKLAGQTLPRYVRVNPLKNSLNDVITHFRAKGYKMVDYPADDYDSFVSTAQALSGKHFMKDYHVTDVLVFPPGTDFHNHDLYKDGRIILQDKASCLPAYLLNPPPGSLVIDCCAAPGNKTTHAAAIMADKGQIFAFDLDKKRAETMRTLCKKAGASCIHVQDGDFLKVDPHDVRYQDVEYMIVDPSCSGSGIASRLNFLTDDDDSVSDQRIENLSKFQISIVAHALTFPNVKRMTYSTCSVNARENEHVVLTVLARFADFDSVSVLPTWSHRGLTEYSFGERCIRAGPEDLTNGFFVAVFERKTCQTTEKNSKSVKKKRKRNRKRKSNEAVSDQNTNPGIPLLDQQSDSEIVEAELNVPAKSGKTKRKRKRKTSAVAEERTMTDISPPKKSRIESDSPKKTVAENERKRRVGDKNSSVENCETVNITARSEVKSEVKVTTDTSDGKVSKKKKKKTMKS